MRQRTCPPTLPAFLPCQGLGPEAACWNLLHAAYARWMATTHTYTSASVGVLHALSCRTWEAHQRAQEVQA